MYELRKSMLENGIHHPARRLLFHGFHGPGGLRLLGQVGRTVSAFSEGVSASCLCGNALCGQADALLARLSDAD